MTQASPDIPPRGQDPDPLLKQNRGHLPDYTYVETAKGLILGALGTKVSDGRYEAFPLHVRTPTQSADALDRRGYRKVLKTDLAETPSGLALVPTEGAQTASGNLLASGVAPSGPHGVLLSGASVTRVWLPNYSVEQAARADPEVQQHREALALIEEAIGSPALVVGSRSFGLGPASSDIDILFSGESTYRRFCERKEAILNRARLEFRSRSELAEVAGRYQRYYRIPGWVAESIWASRFTKVRSQWRRLSFHFTHAYGTDVWPEFEETAFARTVVCEGIVTECGHSAFMPRLYRIRVGGRELTVLTKMFLYAGIGDVGDLVQIRGARIGSDAIVLARYGDYIVKLGH